MTKEELKQYIDDNIYENQDGEITGEALNEVLKAIVDDGGTEVVANPTGEATTPLNKIKIGETNYNIPQTDTSNLVTEQELAQELSGYVQKTDPPSPAAGDIVAFGQYGEFGSSGKKVTDFATKAQGELADTAYQKPSTGIPASDLANAVQISLGKADTAVQSVSVDPDTVTGDAGTNASVTNTGTQTTPILKFTIPRGADAVNPFKGMYITTSDTNIPSSGQAGDYIFIADANPATTIDLYFWNTEKTPSAGWDDTGYDINPGSLAEFAGGTAVSMVHIVNDFTGGAADVLSAEAGKELKEDTDALDGQINGHDVESATDVTAEHSTANRYVNTAGEKIYIASTTAQGYLCILMDVTPGQKYRITGKGGNQYSALWATAYNETEVITNNTKKRVAEADTNTRNSPVEITIANDENVLGINFLEYDSETDKLELIGVEHVDGLEDRVESLENNPSIEVTSETGSSTTKAASQKLVTDINDDVEALDGQINGHDAVAWEEQSLIANKYVNTGSSTLSSNPASGTSEGNYCAIIPVSEGEVLKITGLGGNAYALLYATTDSSRNKVRYADTNQNTRTNPVEITIGNGEAYLYVNLTQYDSTTDKVEKKQEVHQKGIEDRVNDMEVQNNIEVCVPSVINAVVGDTLQLYYRSIFRCVDCYKYDIHVECEIGKDFPRYYEVTPTFSNIGEHVIKFTIKDNNNNILGEKTATLKVSDTGVSPATNINILCLGASGTQQGQWASELKRRLTGKGELGVYYGNTIQLHSGDTIKAIAYKTGSTDSEISSVTYNGVAVQSTDATASSGQTSTPHISVDSNGYVTITCSTSGASINYTLNGTSPTSDLSNITTKPIGCNLQNITFVGRKEVTFTGVSQNTVKLEATGGYSFNSYTQISIKRYYFYVGYAANINLNDKYSVSSYEFTVKEININGSEGGYFSCEGTGNPPASGTLSRVSGTGDESIPYTESTISGNPFDYNGVVDIESYANQYCGGQIDLVITELLGNGTHSYVDNLESRMEEMMTLINDFRSVFPTCKFIIGLAWTPDLLGGWGENYKATGDFSKLYGIKYTVMNYCNTLQKYIDDNELGDYVFIGNWLNEFDEENDFRQTTKKVNVRSNVTEKFGVNGWHPSVVGYYQVADVCWREIISRFCQTSN